MNRDIERAAEKIDHAEDILLTVLAHEQHMPDRWCRRIEEWQERAGQLVVEMRDAIEERSEELRNEIRHTAEAAQ